MEFDVNDLSVARGGLSVLTGVSFRLLSGQALILRGPNGSGKTTLLRTLAGLQNPQHGTISAPAESIAYGAHADGIKSTLSVAENLAFWADIYGTGMTDAALAGFDLQSLAGRRANNLSAGQKRRLGLARMLVTGRPIWLLDEPTVSLDAKGRTQFESAVRRHLDGGGIAVIATHVDIAVQATTLDIGQFRTPMTAIASSFDEAFL